MNNMNLSVSGMNIAARSWGDEKNPPLISLHGWMDNANSFEPMSSYLEKNYYLIALDLPGHGYSDHFPDHAHYHFIDGIYIVLDILDSLNYQKVHLLGHSMGACLASLIAGVIPSRISSLHLIEGLGPFSQPEETAREQLHTYVNRRIRHQKPQKIYKNLEEASLARAKRGYVSKAIAEKLCERNLKKHHDGLIWRHDQRLLTPSALQMTEGQILSCLKAITAPTTLLLASNGYQFTSELLQKRVESVQGLKIHTLEGGHHIHMEKPEESARLLFDLK